MERQQRIPATLSVSLAIFDTSTSRLLVSKLDSDAPKDPFSIEFPRHIYSDIFDFRVEATLEKQPNEKQVLESASSKLVSLSRSDPTAANDHTLAFLGTYESPHWGVSLHFVKYHVLALVVEGNIEVPEHYEWRKVTEVLEDYNAFKYRLSPPTLGIVRGLIADVESTASSPYNGSGSRMYRYWHALAQENENANWGTFTHLEFAPSIECIPIASNTLPPFHATNLVTVQGGDHVLIVDPGANLVGSPHLSSVLSRFSASKMHVFLTHHHHDHIESLGLVGRHFPGCEVIGHPFTIERTKERFGEDTNLVFKEICANDTDEPFTIGEDRSLVALALSGHTRGHLAIWDAQSKTLVSGDHTVGFGSSVLDPDGGGNMKAYLESTRRLLELPVEVILPCHGSPTLIRPSSLLKSYIKHREAREKEILEVWNGQSKEMDMIVEIVYRDTPKNLHAAAKRNVILHLEKLSDEGAITLTEDITKLIQEHKHSD